MEHSIIVIKQKKRIALVAHDNKKQDLVERVEADVATEQAASVDAVPDDALHRAP